MVERRADIFMHLFLIDEAARSGFGEHVRDGLFHLPWDVGGIEADVPVDILLFTRLGTHRPFMGVRRMVDDKIQTEAHCPLNLQRLFAAVLDNRSSRYDILFLKNSVIQVYINFLE